MYTYFYIKYILELFIHGNKIKIIYIYISIIELIYDNKGIQLFYILLESNSK